MATLSELRTALYDVLSDALPTWNVYRLPPDNVDPPGVMIGGFQLDSGTFDDANLRTTVELTVVVSRRHVDQVDALDDLLSPSGDESLWAIFNNDPTLGDVVPFCVVSGAGEYREVTIGDIGYYAASVNLSVMV
jgi:hypothetical protein